MSYAALFSGYDNPLIVVDGADFDGTNDYMTRGADLTGASDSKQFILSAWLRVDGGDGLALILFSSDTTGGGNPGLFRLRRNNSKDVKLLGYNAAGTEILLIGTLGQFITSTTWRHFLISIDLSDTAKRHLYVNDSSDINVTTYTNDTLDFTQGDWVVGATHNNTLKLNGCLAELYFAPGQYLDFSLVSNRRKFISASGKPVHLGTTGALPTGTAPIVYQHLDDLEAVANFATNRGTGGDFSITGTLDTASTSPSD